MSIIKGTNKVVAGFGGTKENIGDVKWSYSKLATDNSGRLPLFTGETIASANTIYPEFYNWVLAHTELQCTSAEYEASLTTYGECAKYVIGSGSLRLPLIRNYIKAANPSEGIKNIEAGLPDHNHTVSGSSNWGSLSQTGNAVALVTQVTTSNASNSNPIYGKSSTVTPASTTLYPWVVAYVAAIPASTAQAAAFQQGLSGKADTSLSNLSAAGKALASGLGMPSDGYINLKLGAADSIYTAPANGWLVLNATANNSSNFIQLKNLTSRITSSDYGTTNTTPLTTFLPVKTTDVINITYASISTTGVIFRFIYAKGAE